MNMTVVLLAFVVFTVAMCRRNNDKETNHGYQKEDREDRRRSDP